MEWFYKITGLLSKIIPRRFAILGAEKIAKISYFTYYKDRKPIVIANFKKVYKNLNKIEAKKLVFATYTNFARLIYEFLILPTINRSNVFEYVKIIHKKRFDNAFKRGKGVIVLTAHLGNWELGAGVLGILGYSPTAIALPQAAPYTRNFFTGRRKSAGVETVYITDGLKPVLAALKQGKVIATLGDRTYSGHTVRANFFDTTLEFPAGTFTLAEHTGAPIIPAFCVREFARNGKYFIYFEPELIGGAQEWASILERYVRKYTTQWFVFDKLWA